MSSDNIGTKPTSLHRASEQSDLRLGEKANSISRPSSDRLASLSPSSSVAPSERHSVTSNATLIERGKQHGNAFDQFELAQELKRLMRAAKSWDVMTDQQHETIEMACTKLSRIGEGDPDHLDHWADLAGYFELTVIIMQGKKV